MFGGYNFRLKVLASAFIFTFYGCYVQGIYFPYPMYENYFYIINNTHFVIIIVVIIFLIIFMVSEIIFN